MRTLRTMALCAPLLVGCGVDVYDPFAGYPVDRDGDGWADLQELDLGSDPENPFNWDFGSGQWPDFTDEAGAALVDADFGWGLGQTMPDFLSEDQYGNTVPLHTFFGYAIVLDFTAGWCPPCQEVAAEAQQTWVEHRLDGVLIIHQVIDDYQQDALARVDEDFQAEWAAAYGIDFPVLLQDAPLGSDAFGKLIQSGVGSGAIPFMVVLDHQMRITASFEGSDQADEAAALAIELAAERDRLGARP